MREDGMIRIRFVKMAIFSGVRRPFSYVRRLPPEDSVVKVRTIRFASVWPLYLRAVRAGGLTHGGNFQKILDNSFQVAAVGRVQPVICRIPFYK
jgi:hypothetical protein